MKERQAQAVGVALVALLATMLVAGAVAHRLLRVPPPVAQVGGAAGTAATEVEQPRRLEVLPGSRLEQIAGAVVDAGISDGRRFLRLARHPGESNLPARWRRLSSLEGYLLPGAYDVEPGAGDEAVLARMLARSGRQLGRLAPAAGRSGITVNEALVLASMVQREVVFPGDTPAVAAVFRNRLQRGMPLESSPTVIYTLDTAQAVGSSRYWTRSLSHLDLKYRSPYNTYLHPGLPPTPIASPGAEAIHAVLDPPEIDDLYIAPKPNGAVAYARDLVAQKRNLRRYRAASGRPAPPRPRSDLQALVERVVAPLDGHVGVVVKNLATGESASLNGGDFFRAASLYKLYVMEAAFDARRRRELAFDSRLKLPVSPEVPDSPRARARLGPRPSVAHALHEMITVSNNAAGTALLARLGPAAVTRLVQREGLRTTWLTHLPYITTAYDVAALLERIAHGTSVDRRASAEMRRLLLGQLIDDRLPRFLRPETRVAHKTGSLDRLRHDAGIVYTRRGPVVIVALTEGMSSEEGASHTIARLGQLVVDYFERYEPARRRLAEHGTRACRQNPFHPRARGALTGRTIVLDPGHGGVDTGARFSPQGGPVMTEKTFVLDIARRLKEKLVRRGATVYMTRCGDAGPSLEARAALSNRAHPDLFMSIHLNGSDDPATDGTGVYYLAREDAPLAHYLLGSQDQLGLWRTLNRHLPLFNLGAHQVRFTVLAYSRAPAVLTESLYMTHPREALALRRPSRRKQIARGHLRGILSWFRATGR
jgi:cell division protein YceG involved in septum cleavage/N-acetylmuramoyl-L-alanine amidase